MMTSRPLIFLFLSFGLSLQAASRLNVLFVATDDFRVEVGAYGDTVVQTPGLDRLARDGMIFQRAYCQQALCNPSRLSMLTGKRPDTLATWNLTGGFRRDPSTVTLPEYLKQNGYFTQSLGKIFHNWREEGHADFPRSWSVRPRYQIGTHGADKPLVAGDLPKDYMRDPRAECREVPDNAYYDGRIADEAVAAIQGFAQQPDQPFFLAVGFWKPHLPFNAPKKYWDLYPLETILDPDPAAPPVGVPQIALENGDEYVKWEPQNDPDPYDTLLQMRRGYYASVSYFDAQVGRLLDALEAQGLRENTIVVFWSDHGFQAGEHGMWAKCSNFELDARVPLIISVPGSDNTGTSTMSLAELVDLFPTLTDLCGLPPPDGLEGESLIPVLRDPEASVKETAFTQHPRPAYYLGSPKVMGYSVRTPDCRYTEWRDWESGGITARELYDHVGDPKETVNLAEHPAWQTQRSQCESLLHAEHPPTAHRK